MRRALLCLLVSTLVIGVVPAAVSAAESPRPRLRFTDWRPTQAAGQPGVDDAVSQPACDSPPEDHQVSRWRVVWVVVPESD